MEDLEEAMDLAVFLDLDRFLVLERSSREARLLLLVLFTLWECWPRETDRWRDTDLSRCDDDEGGGPGVLLLTRLLVRLLLLEQDGSLGVLVSCSF